jgi:superfamily II DNA or RNA helicase
MVINTAREKAAALINQENTFLIVDECHRAGSKENSKSITGVYSYALGLSATPKREYDDALNSIIIPYLGSIIFEYSYQDALKDGVICPFELLNVKIHLMPKEKKDYDKFTKKLMLLLNKEESNQEAIKRTLIQRARISSTAMMRIPVSVKLAEENKGKRTIIFHESIQSATEIFDLLIKRKLRATIYHSRLSPNLRRDNLRL